MIKTFQQTHAKNAKRSSSHVIIERLQITFHIQILRSCQNQSNRFDQTLFSFNAFDSIVKCERFSINEVLSFENS